MKTNFFRWFIKITLIVVVSIVLGTLEITLNDTTLATLFTVAGIIFPLSLNYLVSFPFAEIQKEKKLDEVQEELKSLLLEYIIPFGIITILYAIPHISFKIKWIVLDSDYFALSSVVFVIIFDCYNFYRLFDFKVNFYKKIRNLNKQEDKLQQLENELKENIK